MKSLLSFLAVAMAATYIWMVTAGLSAVFPTPPGEDEFEDAGLHARIRCESLCLGAGSLGRADDMEVVEVRVVGADWMEEPSGYECVCGIRGD